MRWSPASVRPSSVVRPVLSTKCDRRSLLITLIVRCWQQWWYSCFSWRVVGSSLLSHPLPLADRVEWWRRRTYFWLLMRIMARTCTSDRQSSPALNALSLFHCATPPANLRPARCISIAVQYSTKYCFDRPKRYSVGYNKMKPQLWYYLSLPKQRDFSMFVSLSSFLPRHRLPFVERFWINSVK